MVFIKKIDEPDFGCEGVLDNEVVCDTVTFVVDSNEIVVKIPEKIVWHYKLDENMEISNKLYLELLDLKRSQN